VKEIVNNVRNRTKPHVHDSERSTISICLIVRYLSIWRARLEAAFIGGYS
jgi:hypothetical protein